MVWTCFFSFFLSCAFAVSGAATRNRSHPVTSPSRNPFVDSFFCACADCPRNSHRQYYHDDDACWICSDAFSVSCDANAFFSCDPDESPRRCPSCRTAQIHRPDRIDLRLSCDLAFYRGLHLHPISPWNQVLSQTVRVVTKSLSWHGEWQRGAELRCWLSWLLVGRNMPDDGQSIYTYFRPFNLSMAFRVP